MKTKIGIFSGTFDPIHGGHIAFALSAMEAARLDEIYFLPEQMPRRKTGVTHYAHRLAMIKLALKPYKNLKVLELPDKQFSVSRTLPRLKKLLPDSDLHMLVGSDVLEYLGSNQWPQADRLLDSVKLLVGVRSGVEVDKARALLDSFQPAGQIIETVRPHASSRDIRHALMNGNQHQELLRSLESYIKKHWLYASVSTAPNNS